MSRTYRKNIVVKICYGDNRKFYYYRRRKIKNLGRMQLRSLMAKYNPDDVSDMWVEPRFPMKDTWAEPTDGHYGMNRRKYAEYIRHHPYLGDYYLKDFDYYIKPKNRNHYRIV